MEILLLRIDHFNNRFYYVSTLKEWLKTIGILNGRLITIGTLYLLYIEGTTTQINTLLNYYQTKEIDYNTKEQLCIDKFIDRLGRKVIVNEGTCKGFLEMNILNERLLENLLVNQWHCEKEWLEMAFSTSRTKAFLEWKEQAKLARKERRQKHAQLKTIEKQKSQQENMNFSTKMDNSVGDSTVSPQDMQEKEQNMKEQPENKTIKRRKLNPKEKHIKVKLQDSPSSSLNGSIKASGNTVLGTDAPETKHSGNTVLGTDPPETKHSGITTLDGKASGAAIQRSKKVKRRKERHTSKSNELRPN